MGGDRESRGLGNRAAAAGIVSAMKNRLILLAVSTTLIGCVPAEPPRTETGRPLEILPAEARLADVEADLLATARERYGSAAVERALAAETHLIVKRFAGMAPPPPPGARADWRPPTPTAMVIQENRRWYAATPDGWRAANAEAIAELDAIFVSEPFWGDGPSVLPCPDFGASNMLLKMPGKARIVRSHQCTSATSSAVQAALRA